jgi:hypothetical protein
VRPTALETEFARLIAEMRGEVADYARLHPTAEIEITLHVVEPENES